MSSGRLWIATWFCCSLLTISVSGQALPNAAKVPALIAEGDFDAAELEIARLFPAKRPPLADYWLGFIRLKRHRFVEAEGLLRRALARRDDRAAWHHALALALSRQNRCAAALEALDAAIKLEPGVAQFSYDQAMCALDLADEIKAETALRRTLDLEKDHAKAAVALGRLLLDRSATADALPLLEHAVALAPESWEARFQLALAHRDLGQPEAARFQLDRLLAALPKNAGALYNLAQIEKEAGHDQLSKELFVRYRAALADQERLENGLAFLKLQPADHAIRRRVTRQLIELGRTVEALDHLEFLRAQGEDDEAWWQLMATIRGSS